ncbi:hypothetical protein [Mesorhizobium sp. LNJC384A00]|uniref:hypothetical protein n=1 Tax=Mesorhizobium sp. LNJC384A00 TaxID=1287268 RepID=UPI0012EB8B05|nr:hypothetical protein [Mesorhizobium sp. LNJC384A00]
MKAVRLRPLFERTTPLRSDQAILLTSERRLAPTVGIANEIGIPERRPAEKSYPSEFVEVALSESPHWAFHRVQLGKRSVPCSTGHTLEDPRNRRAGKMVARKMVAGKMVAGKMVAGKTVAVHDATARPA